MQDAFGLPDLGHAHRLLFVGGAPAATANWQAWEKPRGISMVQIVCVGAGAGGGGGSTGATGTIRGGGGGGGSGGLVNMVIPASLLPDVLWIQCGLGGAGGAAGATGVSGTAGTRSWVSISPTQTANSVIVVSGNANAAFGTGGSTAAGVGGVASTVFTNNGAGAALLYIGTWAAVAGSLGASAGAVGGAAGGALVEYTIAGTLFTGGAGGGTTPAANTNFAGGAQTGAGILTTIAGGTAAGGDGQPGRFLWVPLSGQGGTGGGTNGAAGVAGVGGDGAYACGGAGGGGGVTGGAGGRGGDGFVIVTCS